MQLFIIVFLMIGNTLVYSQNCPSGAEIYEIGISDQGKSDIVNEHNKYRQMLINGEVPNQPKARYLEVINFDDTLAAYARNVSQQCKMEHVPITDDRWSVGQNLFISWSSAYEPGQDWSAPARSWYNEYENFIYPDSSNGKETGHYTQLVWATTQVIGCDYIFFYDVGQPDYPYAKLYTCNYGPAGNIVGQAPYELA